VGGVVLVVVLFVVVVIILVVVVVVVVVRVVGVRGNIHGGSIITDVGGVKVGAGKVIVAEVVKLVFRCGLEQGDVFKV
jgi:hypothetical protein